MEQSPEWSEGVEPGTDGGRAFQMEGATNVAVLRPDKTDVLKGQQGRREHS